MDGLYSFAAILLGLLLVAFLVSRKPKARKQVYHSDAAWIPPAAAQPTIVDPVHAAAPSSYHSMTVGVWLPLMQAVVTGIILSIAAFVIALLAGSSALLAIRWLGGTFVISVCIIWMSRYFNWTKTVQRLEMLFRFDFNGDGIQGDPVERIDINLHHHDASGNRTVTDRVTLPASHEQMQALAVGILRFDKPFSEKTWAGSGRPFSQIGLKRLREGLEKLGLIAGRGSGWEFTETGREMLAGFLPDDGLPPLPHQAGRVTELTRPSSIQASKQAS